MRSTFVPLLTDERSNNLAVRLNNLPVRLLLLRC